MGAVAAKGEAAVRLLRQEDGDKLVALRITDTPQLQTLAMQQALLSETPNRLDFNTLINP